jgi:hypothetical protein
MLYLKNQQMAIGLSGIVVVCTNGKTQLKIQMDEFLKIKMTEFSVGSMLVILQFRRYFDCVQKRKLKLQCK